MVGVALVLATLGFGLYRGLWNNGFYRDDYMWLDIAKSISESPAYLFSPDPVNTEAVMRQTQRLVFALVYAMNGTAPQGYHLVSLMLHGLAAILVWRLLALLARQFPHAPASARSVAALAGAIYFSSTFCHSHAVLWASAQSSLLVTAVLASVMAHVVQQRNAPLNRRFVLVLVLGYALALYSNNMAASFPLVLAFYFWTVLREGSEPTKQHAKLLLGLSLFSAAHVLFTKAWLGRVDILDTLGDPTQGDYLMSWNVLRNLAGAVLGVFVPADLYFARWTRAIPFEVAAVVVVALALLLSWRSRYRRGVVLGLVWIVVCALPVSLFDYQQYSIEQATVTRYYYLPAVGAAVIVMSLVLRLHEMLERHWKPATVVLAALAVGYVAFQDVPLQREVAHLHRWGDSRAKLIEGTLSHALRNYPRGSIIYADNWFIDAVYILNISHVYFEAHGYSLQGQSALDELVATRSLIEGPRFVATFDSQAHRLRLRSLGAHIAALESKPPGGGG